MIVERKLLEPFCLGINKFFRSLEVWFLLLSPVCVFKHINSRFLEGSFWTAAVHIFCTYSPGAPNVILSSPLWGNMSTLIGSTRLQRMVVSAVISTESKEKWGHLSSFAVFKHYSSCNSSTASSQNTDCLQLMHLNKTQ